MIRRDGPLEFRASQFGDGGTWLPLDFFFILHRRTRHSNGSFTANRRSPGPVTWHHPVRSRPTKRIEHNPPRFILHDVRPRLRRGFKLTLTANIPSLGNA